MARKREKIVILGGGFAGLNCALALRRKLRSSDHQLVLVDQHPYHLFTPGLYQAGVGETPNRCICIPLAPILEPNGIRFVRDRVLSVDTASNVVRLEAGGSVDFTILVVALGNKTDFFGVPGLREHAIPFKTVYQAGELRLALRRLFKAKPKGPKRLVIGGGGFTGCELGGELVLRARTLAAEYGLPLEDVRILVIEGADRLLPGLPPKVSDVARRRLESLGVELILGRRIKRVDWDKIELSAGEPVSYDLLVWTGGVSGRGIEVLESADKDRRGNYAVDGRLQTADAIFVVGDLASCTDPATGRPLPGTAPLAVHEAKWAAKNISRLIRGSEPRPYRPRHSGYIIPLTGKYAIAVFNFPGNPMLTGRPAFALFQVVVFRYFLRILPFAQALGRWREWVSNVKRGLPR